MLSEDREEFSRQVAILCAAYNVPVGEREEFLWRAFSRLSIVEFSRIVDAAISPDCEFERFPTVKQIWGLRKQSRIRSASVLPAGAQVALVEYTLANRSLNEWQRTTRWSWIANGGEFLGLIVPQDPREPEQHAAIRVLFADVDWRPFLRVA